jgi:hypothetical protein
VVFLGGSTAFLPLGSIEIALNPVYLNYGYYLTLVNYIGINWCALFFPFRYSITHSHTLLPVPACPARPCLPVPACPALPLHVLFHFAMHSVGQLQSRSGCKCSLKSLLVFFTFSFFLFFFFRFLFYLISILIVSIDRLP